MSAHPETFVTTARIRAGSGTDVLIAVARERAPDPTVFDDHAPFFWLSEISNDRMDGYYGYMDAATTLVNFSQDAAEGRAILAAHNRWDLPFGYSLTGTVERAENRTRVLSDAYTLRGLTLGGVQTDSFIDGVRAGVLRDISVGFALGDAGWYRCNVCNNDLMDWRACSHYPGMTYEVKGEDGVIRDVLATFTVIDARLSEYSSVYDGATPSAGVLKIHEGARAGRLDDRQLALLQSCYRVRLPLFPTRPAIVPGIDLEDRSMPDDTALVVAPPTPLGDLADLRAALVLPDDTDVLAALRALAAELPTLRALAADGQAYRTALIDEALAEAVRALGPDAHDRYAEPLAALPLSVIRQMRDDWRVLAGQRLPTGRLTVDQVSPPPSAPAPSAAQDATYAA